MKQPDYNMALNSVMLAAMYAAPDESTKEAFKRFARECASECAKRDHDYLRRLVGGLYDGLAYGNWPNTF